MSAMWGETDTTVIPLLRMNASSAETAASPERANSTMRASSKLATLMHVAAAASIDSLKACRLGARYP